jgi:predicted metal-binding membrane protein
MQSILRQVSSRPRIALWACLVAITTLSAISLLMISRQNEPWWSLGLLRALCSPGIAAGEDRLASSIAMWSAMVLAMMLPQAAPMLLTYLDIAEAARVKSIAVVSAFVLAGGYVTVWLIFAGAAALLQDLAGTVSDRSLAGALFIAAGTYQFTPLKHACLTKCRHPMPYFLARWTESGLGVFRMGVEQGLVCLGCCWAIMLLAFIAGAMNLAWMALIGAVMILEKVLSDPRALTMGLGSGFVVAGLLMLMGA